MIIALVYSMFLLPYWAKTRVQQLRESFLAPVGARLDFDLRSWRRLLPRSVACVLFRDFDRKGTGQVPSEASIYWGFRVACPHPLASNGFPTQ